MKTGLTSNIVPLDRLTAAEEGHSGAKAYNCARLKQAGFPVPDGLVVLSTLPGADLTALTDHPWFDGLAADVVFAVRSSGIGEDGAGESFAGIHQTLLNVCRADLAAAVAACRASAHSTQALEYRRAKSMSTEALEMGILIQRMIHPVAAGVAFTVNPVTGAGDELVINSSWGVGEALVSGQIDPDEFVVAKRDRGLRWSRLGEKGSAGRAETFSLTPDQVRELAEILIRIEQHYGSPQDVEWCHDGTGFWIVQSRPVTTRRASLEETEWTRANIAEVLPDITPPQVLAAFEDLLNLAERQQLGRLMAPEEELGPMVKSFCGRLHFNLSQLRRVCAIGGTAPAAMLRSMGHAGAIQPADEIPPRPGLRQLACAPDLVRIVWRHIRAARMIRRHDAKTREYLREFGAVDPHRLPDAEVWSIVEKWRSEAPGFMQTVLLLGNVLFHETPVRKACERVDFPFERLVYPQLATGARSISAQQAFDLVALAEIARREPAVVEFLSAEAFDMSHVRASLRGTAFLAAFERFLEKYGHRGRYEYDWSLPRYHEEPAPLLRALRVHVENGSDTCSDDKSARQAREAADAWAAFERRLSSWQRRTVLPGVRRSLRKIKQYYLWREQVRSDIARVIGALRRLHLTLAQRFADRGWLERPDDYFLLRLEEVGSMISGRRGPETLRGVVADRIVEQERNRSIQMPLLMRASELAGLIRTAGISGASDDDRELSGQAVSGGCVEAEVVIVRDPGDFGRMKRGAILVAPATDPSWTPLFTLASGVIVEVGGVLSHASTIAREYGLPALANVKHATRRLKTGERVRLDAINGVVHKLPATREPLEV